MSERDDGPWIRRWDGGASWIAHPDEDARRASHLLELGGDRYAIEPVDFPSLDAELAGSGSLDGIVVLMDRHLRDAESIADRHAVSVFAPGGFDRLRAKAEVDVLPLAPVLEGTSYEGRTIVNRRFWEEMALWSASDETLVVPEALGTNAFFRTGAEAVGVHPTLRMRPPRRSLGGLRPRRLLVGHGKPVMDLDPAEVERSLRDARRRLPRAWVGILRDALA